MDTGDTKNKIGSIQQIFIMLRNILLFFKSNKAFSAMFITLIFITIGLVSTLVTKLTNKKSINGITPYYADFLDGKILKQVNRDNIYFIVALVITLLISLSYVITFLTTTNTDISNSITNKFTFIILGIFGLCFIGLWLYTSTQSLSKADTPAGRLYTTVKVMLKYVIIAYAIYYVLFKTKLLVNITNPIKNMIIYPVYSFIMNDMSEWNKIDMKIKIIIAIIFGLTFVSFIYKPFINTFVKPNQKEVLAMGLNLREKNIIKSYDELNPNFESVYQKTQDLVEKQDQNLEGKNHNTTIINNVDGMDYTYGLRFKYFLHEVGSYTPIDKDIIIFTYGGKPTLTFNPIQQKMKFIIRDNMGNNIIVYENKNIKYQKWEEITINFVNGVVDVFLNRVLISTKNVLPYNSKDSIILGHENGIEGAIDKIEYSKTPYIMSN